MTKQTRKRRSDEEWRLILQEYETAPVVDDALFTRLGVHNSMVYKHRHRLGLKWPRGDKRNMAKLAAIGPAATGTELVPVAAAPVRTKTGGRKSKYPAAVRAKAIEMHASGLGPRAISDQLKLGGHKGEVLVSYWIRRAKLETQVIPAPAKAKPVAVESASAIGVGTQASIALLKQSEREAMRLIRSNKLAKLDSAHLLAMLALRSMTGD